MDQRILDKYGKEYNNIIGEYVSPLSPDGGSPMRDYVINERENFEKFFAWEKTPYLANIDDTQAFAPRLIPDNYVRAWALEMEACLPGSDCPGGKDMFGVTWEYIKETGGSMVRGGDPLIKDINRWEDYVKFPDLDDFDWERSAKVNEKLLSGHRMNRVWIMNGLNERLISFMDFAPTMIAYVDEDQKESVKRLFDKLCDFYDDLIDRFRKYYHADIIMFNDDWGTKKGPQFSPDTLREMIIPYIKRIAESCHKRGMYFELHCCGQNELLAPVMPEADIDLWIPQENLAHYDELFETVGDKLHLGIPTDSKPDMSDEEAWDCAMRFWEKYGKSGNVVLNTTMPRQHPRIAEFLYCISRNAYDNE